MGVEGFLAGEEGRAAEALIAQAGLILKGTRDDVPDGFAAALFARTSAEDLVAYEARDLAALAAAAFDHLAQRTPGGPDIRVGGLAAPAGSRLAAVTVVEIVNDDMAFLVDSVIAELAEQGVEVRLLAHPVFTVERDAGGALLAWLGEAPGGGARRRESLIHLHVPAIEDEAARTALVQGLEATLADVRLAVTDWKAMRQAALDAIAGLEGARGVVAPDAAAEAAAFLRWLAAENFVFLGSRNYVVTERGELDPDFASGLGILRAPEVRVLRRGAEVVTMTPEIRGFLASPEPIIVTKANVRSRVHRRVHMDYVGVKRTDAAGQLTGELRFVGLFASSAYSGWARAIPLLRRKLDAVVRRAGFDLAGHSGKALGHVLEGYPRDDLFEIDEDLLFQHAVAILELGERPRVRVLTRHDRFDRFVSVLVFVPRDRYDSSARVRIGELLAETFRGRVVAAQPTFGQGTLVRVRFVIGRYEGATPTPDRRRLEDQVARLVRTWADGLADALAVVHAPDRAAALGRRWRGAFGAGYRDFFSPEQAVADIRVLENLSPEKPIAIDFYHAPQEPPGRVGLKVWSLKRAMPLSERVPMLENLGFTVVNERTHRLEPAAGEHAWLHDMTIAAAAGAVDLAALDRRLEATLMAVLKGEAENDGFNALTLVAGVPWRDVTLVRTLAHYLRQIGLPFSLDSIWSTLARHPAIAAGIVALFHARFDPRRTVAADARAAAERALVGEIEDALGDVASLDEDRILRHLVNLVQAAVRTNYYQIAPDGGPRPAIAVKFDSRRVESLPAPRPLYEIFVSSPRMEGVHLRFGKVARGGLRWSDRPQDFRTEVLGLVKAQQVKNAVIVPVGAKGGFVPRRLPPPSDRAAWMAEGTEAYRLFVRSLLDVTDTIEGEAIVPPANTVRHDGDDPYLVVAADKGTATLSDTANALALERGFWLGDAFASGGSAGYDHKGMGITARGAFEAAKRHFREMDVDITATPVTVAGVGDMSGDVFGNGLLLSRTYRLLAAFDHRDIFLDPDPDPATSWAERKRLYDLPRSSWQDYDTALISRGGGVYPRSLKSIPLPAQARALLGLAKAEATPAEVMHAILKLPVDMLWFGGIGTYVRAASEGNDAVGDRANDAIRVTGRELRCRVVVEGANLGLTQRGRIEAARAGVRLNTDAIDNSAGVNTSDVEVNIKVALGPELSAGRLDEAARNALLVAMTDEVAAAVLRNNYLQTLAISLAERRGPSELGFHQRAMQALETTGRLDRAIEFLPDDAELAERRKAAAGLTRPEIAVLLAYAKLTLYDDLLASPVPDDPYLAGELRRYFPAALREGWPDAIAQHRLRREIIATNLANSMINRGGPALVVRIADQTGAAAPAIARAFLAVRDAYGMTALNGAIDALDARVDGATQLSLYAAVQDLLLSRVVWMLRTETFAGGLDPIVARHRAGVAALAGMLDALLPPAAAEERARHIAALVDKRVPEDLARRIADLPALALAPDAVLVAERTGTDVPAAAATLVALAARFELRRLASAAAAILPADRFDRLAIDRALDGLDLAARRLAIEVIAGHGPGADGVTAWAGARGAEVERIARALAEIAASGLTLAKLTLAASLLGDLLRG